MALELFSTRRSVVAAASARWVTSTRWACSAARVGAGADGLMVSSTDRARTRQAAVIAGMAFLLEPGVVALSVPGCGWEDVATVVASLGAVAGGPVVAFTASGGPAG